jgi:hypothetical protein
VHLADLLVERAAVERDAERVRLDGTRLVVAAALLAGVVARVVAVVAVVDLALYRRLGVRSI